MKSLNLTITETRPIRHYSPVNKSRTEPRNTSPLKPTRPFHQDNNPSIIESIIGNIDDYVHPTTVHVVEDFDINDIEDVMGMKKKQSVDENTNNMDNDSLESSEGVLEEKKKPSSTKKSSGYVSAFYLAQKQKFQEEQAANRKRSITNLNRYSSRSTTLSNVIDANKKEGQATKQRRKPMTVPQRSQSSDLIDKNNDTSKLDRDSGFDEQDFRRERLNSNGDDNSSISSIKSIRSSTVRSEIRENKSYELRMKKLDTKRNSTDKGTPSQTRRNLDPSLRRGSELIPPTPPVNKHRKNSQPIVQLKLPAETESLIL
jgi:hypothetical protein